MNKEHFVNFGSTIKRFRKTKKVSQKVMAEKLKIPIAKLRDIENGKKEKPPKGFAKKAAAYFGVPLNTIFVGILTEKDIKPKDKKLFEVMKPVIDQLAKYLISVKK